MRWPKAAQMDGLRPAKRDTTWRLRHWHRWYAWHPVRVREPDTMPQWVWLEYVARRGTVYTGDDNSCSWAWDYKL